MKSMTLVATFKKDDSYDNEKFIRMRAKIMHSSVNPNQSSFEKSVIDEAESSIYITPVLANVVIDEEGAVDFGAHDFHLEKSKTNDGSIRLIYDEQPLGVIPENCNYEILLEDGIYYVYADLYIFKPYINYAADVFDNNEEIKLSMEIYVDKYKHNNSTGITDILAYRYKGITLLGSKFGTGMRGAKAEQYTLEDSKQKMLNMMTELKFSLGKQSTPNGDDINNYEEGGTVVLNEKLAMLQKYNVTVDNLDFEIDSLSLEDLELKLIDFTKTKNDKNDAGDGAPKNQFELSWTEKIDEIYCLLSKQTYEHPYWGEISRYSLVDLQGGEVIVWDASDNYRIYGIAYQENGDAISLDFENAKRKKTVYEDFLDTSSNEYFEKSINSLFGVIQGKIKSVEEDFETYKSEHPVSLDDYNALKEFRDNAEAQQRSDAEKEIFDRFDSKLSGVDDYTKLKDNSNKYEIEALEKECFSILGRETANFSLNVNLNVNSKNKNQVKVPIDNTVTFNDDGYGGLFAKHNKKPLN